jgi:tetratricopeptide (TPR) repeat protein
MKRLGLNLPILLMMLASSCSQPRSSEESQPAGRWQPPAAPECTSLLGRPLLATPPGNMDLLLGDLSDAKCFAARQPESADGQIWIGRRLGYLWRMNEAIAAFTAGAERWPDDPRFYRHRGHRYIAIRRFDDAIVDLERAARMIEGRPDAVEPDGMPNEKNIPLTTTGFNVWYHLALARYLKGDFEAALAGWRKARDHARGIDDNIVALADWEYMTLRRLGRTAEAAAVVAPVHAGMTLIENHAYLRRVRMYKGELRPEDLLADGDAGPLDVATQGYGVGNWDLYNGDEARARATFQRVVDGPYWPAFGHIAAEAELARMH